MKRYPIHHLHPVHAKVISPLTNQRRGFICCCTFAAVVSINDPVTAYGCRLSIEYCDRIFPCRANNCSSSISYRHFGLLIIDTSPSSPRLLRLQQTEVLKTSLSIAYKRNWHPPG